jgi:hypothetical protein
LIRKQATVNLPVLAIVVKIFMGGKQGQAWKDKGYGSARHCKRRENTTSSPLSCCLNSKELLLTATWKVKPRKHFLYLFFENPLFFRYVRVAPVEEIKVILQKIAFGSVIKYFNKHTLASVACIL